MKRKAIITQARIESSPLATETFGSCWTEVSDVSTSAKLQAQKCFTQTLPTPILISVLW